MSRGLGDVYKRQAYDATIRHLLDQKEYIYELTFLGRNDLIKHMGNK